MRASFAHFKGTFQVDRFSLLTASKTSSLMSLAALRPDPPPIARTCRHP